MEKEAVLYTAESHAVRIRKREFEN